MSKKFLLISILTLLLLPSFVFAIDVPGWPLVPCGLNAQPQVNGVELPKTGPGGHDYTKACGRCDLFQLLKNLIDFTIGGLMPPLAILLFVWAGFLILLGGANPGWYTRGQTIFKDTFFGIIILLSAWMITNTLILSIGSNYNNASNWWQFTCTEPVPVNPPVIGLVVTTNALSNGYQSKNYSQSLSAGGGTPPYTWSISSGSLPSGLALSGSTISGIPATTGTFSFTVKVSDSSGPVKTTAKSFNIIINVEGALAIDTPSLPDGVVGQAYSQQIAGRGGITPYSWAVQGLLPSGLNVNQSSGVISGTPITAGSYSFTVVVTDSSNPKLTATRPLSIVVAGTGASALSITTSSLPGGTVNQQYDQTIQVSGGTTPYAWTRIGSLPAGLSFNIATGAITGTPTVAGTSTFTVRVTDNSTPQQSAEKQLSIVVGSSTLTCGQPWEQNLCQPRSMTCGASACNQYVSAINQYAGRTSVANGANFLKAIMIKESACNVGVQSNSVPSSCGLMQLKASTANIYKSRCGITENITCDWLKNSVNANASICIAAEYMGALTQTSCGGTPRGVAAGYNGGSGACQQSQDCSGQTSCAGGTTQRWECLYDNPQQNVCNTGYAETRDYATKVLYCYNNPGF